MDQAGIKLVIFLPQPPKILILQDHTIMPSSEFLLITTRIALKNKGFKV